MRGTRRALPLHPVWASEDEYVDSLLTFTTSSDLFRNLCGGVHILDFLTREPDLYETVLPPEWRVWFDQVSVDQVLDMLLRQDLAALRQDGRDMSSDGTPLPSHPPDSLLNYIETVRRHSLDRYFHPVSDSLTEIPRTVSVGMKVKKVHEVTNFAAYVRQLSDQLADDLDEPVSVVDFGSGQNYLGRTLASSPYNKHVIAIERKHHNIAGARTMDVHAKLARREKVMRNKKEYKRRLALMNGMPTPPPEEAGDETVGLPVAVAVPDAVFESLNDPLSAEFDPDRGSLTYVEHDVRDGHLETILYPFDAADENPRADGDAHAPDAAEHGARAEAAQTAHRPKCMVISLHSCGNLSHHGLRSLVLNSSIHAVAIIGCCYNLLTERLGPATYKLPRLRPNHPRLEATGSAYDPHGFPMSSRLEHFEHECGTGVKLNITARMMAVQAPYNWGPKDSEAFFRRHFYRALLQRILLDVGVVQQCPDPGSLAGGSVTGRDTKGTPLIVGSLRKSAFASFQAYVSAALARLGEDPVDGPRIQELTHGITPDVIDQYERRWGYAQKNLAIIWSLMAFSAGVVESIIAVDRWLYLREQPCVAESWVDVVFDYKWSPRNLVVVGIKRDDRHGGLDGTSR